MKPWMIDKRKREQNKERPRIPLYLPLSEVSPSGSTTYEEGKGQGTTEIDYRV